VTGQYLSGAQSIDVPPQRTPVDSQRVLTIAGAAGNNLQKISVTIPVGLLTCVTGVSGSGKSTLINNTLYPAMAKHLHAGRDQASAHDAIARH
jgi:excinuclease ABC subunit A